MNYMTKEEKIKLVNISAGSFIFYALTSHMYLTLMLTEDIMNKNTRLILGLIWTLILRFQISKAEFGDDPNAGPKKALLEWCNRVLNPQGVYVKDFTSSWQDGAAFCGLVNVIQPDTVDLSKLDKDNERVKNCDEAFTKGEDLFGITRLLDAEDVVKSPDELSVMSYVSLYRAYLGAVTPAAEHCKAEGPGLTEAVCKDKAFFTVITYNDVPERITRGGANVMAMLTSTDGKKTKAIVKDKLDGTYECHYVVNTPGEYTLEIIVAGKPIANSPWHPVARPGGPGAGQCTAEGEGVEQVTAGKSAEFLIRSRDERGNTIEEGGSTFISTFQDHAGDITVEIKDNNNGTYTGTYTAKTTGKWPLIILLKTDEGDQHIKDSPFQVVVVAGALDPMQVEVFGKGLEIVVAGETGEFTAQAKDSFGNKLVTGGNALGVQVGGPADVPVETVDNGDGTYKATYVPTKVGEYNVAVTFDGQTIPRSPFAVKVVPAAANAATTEAEGEGLTKATAGEPAKVNIITKDQFGNKLVEGGAPISGSLSGPEEVPVSVIDNGDGTYTAEYDPKIAGEYTLNLKLGDDSIKDAPFKVVVSPSTGDASQAQVDVDGVKEVVAGETGEFGVQAKDAFGNNLLNGGNALAATLDGPAPVEVATADNGDGSYKGSFVPTVTGEYKLGVTFDGAAVPNSPFAVKVVPAAANAATTEASGEGLHNADAGVPNGFKVQTKDKFGNNLTSGGAPITASIVLKSDPSVVGPATVKDNGDGTYDVDYPAIEKAGDYIIDVKLGEENIKDAPFDLHVAPNDKVDSNNCYVEGIEDCIAGVPQTATVHVLDPYGNHLVKGGASVSATISGADDAASEVKDNGDGTYSVNYTPTVAGKYTVDIKVNEGPVKDNPFKFELSPSDVNSTHTVLEGAGLTKAKVAKDSTFKVSLRDKYDNHIYDVPEGTTVVGFLTAEGQEQVDVSVDGPSDGKYSAKYKLRKPGNWTLNVLVNNEHGQGSPFTVKVTPGAVHVPNTKVVKKDGIAGKEGTTLTLVDSEGNSRHKGGQKVRAEYERPLAQEGGAKDNGDGTFTLIHPKDASGAYKVKVFVGDEEVPGGALDISVGENPVPEETQQAVNERLPNAGPAVNELLKKATDEERAALLNDLAALGGSPAPAAAAAAPAPVDNSERDALAAKNEELQEELKQARQEAAEARAAAAAAPAPATDDESPAANPAAEAEAEAAKAEAEAAKAEAEAAKAEAEAAKAEAETAKEESAKLASEVEDLKAQLAEAKAAPAPAHDDSSSSSDVDDNIKQENEALGKKLAEQEHQNSLVQQKLDETGAELAKAQALTEELQKQLEEAKAAAAPAPVPAAEPTPAPVETPASPKSKKEEKSKSKSKKAEEKAEKEPKKEEKSKSKSKSKSKK
jgi:filamin